VLATFLTEMDGINNSNNNDDGNEEEAFSNNVIVMAATNRLDFIDAALIRKVFFVYVSYIK
jgi:SpoVK/Ycf46/Vps4 family AAA+-type ATPase